MNKLESGNIFLEKYREIINQCENIVIINRCKTNKFEFVTDQLTMKEMLVTWILYILNFKYLIIFIIHSNTMN